MSRLLYEKSVSYQGYLIIPFVFAMVDDLAIYSYKLLSEVGNKGQYHKSENPAEIYSDSIQGIIEVAEEHIAVNSDGVSREDYFKCRYTYRHNLIIVHEVAGKYFYDHYKPETLSNIAAPKLFKSEQACLSWIKQGLDRSHKGEATQKGSRSEAH